MHPDEMNEVAVLDKEDAPDGSPTAEAEPHASAQSVGRGRRARSGAPSRTHVGRTWLIVAGIFAVIAVIGVVTSVVTAPHKAKKVASVGNGPVPPRGPNTLVYDTFDRLDNAASLGRTATGQPWAVVGVPWAIQGGQASVAKADQSKRTVAVVDLGFSDGSVQVAMSKVVAGSGIVFRYRDASNYWAVTAAPRYGTWNLQKAVDGTVTTLGNVGLVGANDGTTIRVTFDRSHITIEVNGIEERSFNDADLVDETQVGMVGIADTSLAARWDNFVGSVLAPRAGVASTPSTENSS